MKALGMSIRIDEIGNVTGVYPGATDLPPVMIGSHIDTVGTGGIYDGNYGVLSGLEVVETLKDAGIRPHRPVAVTFFTNEEGVRFQPDMMGSVVWSKQYPLADALAAKDMDGVSVGEALAAIGYKGEAKTGDFAVDSYLELHIEQGPILDKDKINIGVVTGVQGISWNEYTIKGVTNHAGTTPMRMRHDAGLVAAKIATYAREISKTLGGNQVATVGYIDFKPNLINVIPDHAVVTIDLRNTDNELLKQAEKCCTTTPSPPPKKKAPTSATARWCASTPSSSPPKSSMRSKRRRRHRASATAACRAARGTTRNSWRASALRG